jgi:hypothetical protein
MTAKTGRANAVSLEVNGRGAGGMMLHLEKQEERRILHQALGRGESTVRPIARVLVTTFARLAHDTSRPNWGSEDELPIALEDWAWAEKFVSRIAKAHPELPRPLPSPCGDGSVHLMWLGIDSRRYVLEHKGGRVFFSSRDGEGQYLTGELQGEEEAVDRLVAFFS